MKLATKLISTKEQDYTISCSFDLQKLSLSLKFQLSGNLEKILWPNTDGNHQRKDHLWKQSCFELFIKNKNKSHYYEFNYGPKSFWNIYTLSSYRKNLTPLLSPINPQIYFHQIDQRNIDIQVTQELCFLEDYLEAKKMQINLCCVIMHKDQSYEYWALKHLNKPDFHDPNTFSLEF